MVVVTNVREKKKISEMSAINRRSQQDNAINNATNNAIERKRLKERSPFPYFMSSCFP